MTTEDALIAAVLANPADDLPRDVLADWLDENGQPERAEFIRLQCHAARVGQKDHEHAMRFWDCLNCSESWWPDVCNSLRLKTTDWGIRNDGSVGYVSKHHGNSFVVRRGFVSEIRCTLADWCGGECPMCRGAGRDGPEHEMMDVADEGECPHCHGTGRTTGIGPQVAASHPVERVVVQNGAVSQPVEPGYVTLGDITYRTLYRSMDGDIYPHDSHSIRGEVFDLINLPPYGRSGGTKLAATRDAALDALSAALIAWAKSQPHPARLHLTPVSADLTHV